MTLSEECVSEGSVTIPNIQERWMIMCMYDYTRMYEHTKTCMITQKFNRDKSMFDYTTSVLI